MSELKHNKKELRKEVIKSLDYALLATELSDEPIEDYISLCMMLYVESTTRRGRKFILDEETKKNLQDMCRGFMVKYQ